MAYNSYDPYNAINSIYGLKKAWHDADKAGDTEKKNDYAARARQFYNELSGNGYADVAAGLEAVDYTGAKSIHDTYAKKNKSAIRPYFYELGKQYGLSKSDIDSKLSYDDATGMVTFAGKNLGKPYSKVDGTSYWDENRLKSEFSDFVKRTNTTLSDSQLSSKNSTEANEKINKYWDTILGDRDKYYGEYDKASAYANSDVTKTAEYKSAFDNIMPHYKWQSGLAGRNAAASGAASNGGNIDSYSAANAARQQAAMTAKGQALAHQMGLEAYNARVQNAKSLLGELGGYQQASWAGLSDVINTQQTEAQRHFENDQTAKNNEVTRKKTIAEVTGYSPIEWSMQNDGFFRQYVDENGKLKSEYENIDFQDLYEKAKNAGKDDLAEKYAILRGLKISGNPDKYGKFIGEGATAYYQTPRTQAALEFLMQMEQTERMTNNQIAAEQAMLKEQLMAQYNLTELEADKLLEQLKLKLEYGEETGSSNGDSGKNDSSMTLAQATTAIKNGELSDVALAVYNDEHGTSYTKDNPPPIYEPKTVDEESKWWEDPDVNTQRGSGENNYIKFKDKIKTKNQLESLITEWLYSLDGLSENGGYFRKDWNANTNTIYAARDKLNDPQTYAYLKNELLACGYTEEEANRRMKNWKNHVASKAAEAEGKSTETIKKNWGWN